MLSYYKIIQNLYEFITLVNLNQVHLSFSVETITEHDSRVWNNIDREPYKRFFTFYLQSTVLIYTISDFVIFKKKIIDFLNESRLFVGEKWIFTNIKICRSAAACRLPSNNFVQSINIFIFNLKLLLFWSLTLWLELWI
jgi:hypothetical protein